VSEFVNSGIMDGEARALEYFSLVVPDLVPKYRGLVSIHANNVLMGLERGGLGNIREFMDQNNSVDLHQTSTETAPVGLVMELLKGEDMHELRERTWNEHKAQQRHQHQHSRVPTSLLEPKDALFLTVTVLNILQNLHYSGMIHRDVKPSNFVRCGIRKNDRSFKVVDFGLTKSFIVPPDSADAVMEQPWYGISLNDLGKDGKLSREVPPLGPNPSNSNNSSSDMDVDSDDDEDLFGKERQAQKVGRSELGPAKAFYRRPRPQGKAEFRGASMYASPHVHNLEEYCPRDDLFSCLYIYLDFIGGGLPWAAAASQRQRDECGRQKQECTKDPAKFLRDPHRTPATVYHITAIMQHLSTLTYFDMPNYELIRYHLRKMTDEIPKTSCCRLFWRAPVPHHSRPDKEADLQLYFAQMMCAFHGKTPASDKMKLRTFIRFSRFLMRNCWSREYEKYPRHIGFKYRHDNLVYLIDEAMKCAESCNYFRSRQYYPKVKKGPNTMNLTKVSGCFLFLRSLKAKQMKKPVMPPPALSFSQNSY